MTMHDIMMSDEIMWGMALVGFLSSSSSFSGLLRSRSMCSSDDVRRGVTAKQSHGGQP